MTGTLPLGDEISASWHLWSCSETAPTAALAYMGHIGQGSTHMDIPAVHFSKAIQNPKAQVIRC